MVTLDDQVNIIMIGFILVTLLTSVGGFSYHDLLAPLNLSIAKTLIGVDLYGIDTMILLSAIILFGESLWPQIGWTITYGLPLALLWFLASLH